MRTIVQAQARSCCESGLRLQEQRKWEEPEEAFKDALKIDPEHAEACFALAEMYYSLGQTHLDDFYVNAVELFRRAAVIYEKRIQQIASALETIELVRRSRQNDN